MRAVYRRPPRLLVRQFHVWFAWFLLSGYVFHDRTEREIRALPVLVQASVTKYLEFRQIWP